MQRLQSFNIKNKVKDVLKKDIAMYKRFRGGSNQSDKFSNRR